MRTLGWSLLAAVPFAAGLLGACGGACPEQSEPVPAATAGSEGAADEGAGVEGACLETADAAGRAGPAHEAEVRPLDEAPRRAAPPGTATVAMLARGDNAFVARLEMEPHAAVPEHRDADEEYIHVLEGHGTMWIDGTEHEVTPGATIYMPADATVRFQNGDERLVAIQIFAGPESSAKYDRWTPVETPDGPAE